MSALTELLGLCFLETRSEETILLGAAMSADYVGGLIKDVLGPVVR